MKIKLDVPKDFMPEGKCPLVYDFKTSIRHYRYCIITGTWCSGNLDDQPEDCPIVEVEDEA
jgi:hypothetical protein